MLLTCSVGMIIQSIVANRNSLRKPSYERPRAILRLESW